MLGPTLEPTPGLDRLVALPPELLNSIVALLLGRAVAANEALGVRGPITRWHAKVPSPITIPAYMNRLTVYTPFPRDAVLLALLYLDRTSRLPVPMSPPIDPTPILPALERDQRLGSQSVDPSRRPTPLLNSYTLHRLLMSTLLVAAKFISDSFIPQGRAAKVGGVSMQELVRLEVDILVVLGWDLRFTLSELESVAQVCLREGEKDGLLEKAEVVDCCSPLVVVEPIKDEEQGAAEDLSRTPMLPPTLPRNLPSPLEWPAPLPADVSSIASSLSTSPSLYTAAGSATSSTPPSSVGDDGSGDEGLTKSDSAETIRKMEQMSLNGPRSDQRVLV